MTKVALADIASTNASTIVSTTNSNNAAITTVIENTLSRDGSSPNQMNSLLDMNTQRIINLPAASSSTEPVRKAEFDALVPFSPINIDKLTKVFHPENYYSITHPDMSIAVQACIDAAGNYSSSQYARQVLFSDLYPVSTNIFVRPYVPISGIGSVRSGMIAGSGFTAGPLLDCDAVGGVSGSQYAKFDNFGLWGGSSSGSAYALRIQGQKHTLFSQLLIYNWVNTTQPAAQFIGTCQSLFLQKVHFLNNKYHERISSTAPGIFPTTIDHNNCVYEGGLVNTGSTIEITDANSISYSNNCVFQSNGNKSLFGIFGTTNRSTTHEHVWDTPYLENNGGNQAGANSWLFSGTGVNLVDNCTILNPRTHGTAPLGRHIGLSYTDGFRLIRGNSVQPMVTDNGNNSNWDIDATQLVNCDLQTASYTRSVLQYTISNDAVQTRQGPITLTPARQAVGRTRVTFSKAFKTSPAPFMEVTCLDENGAPKLLASSILIDSTHADVYLYNTAGTQVDNTASGSAQIRFTISGELA